jgi:hypothetical protein
MRFPLYASRIIPKTPPQMEDSPGGSEKLCGLVSENDMIVADKPSLHNA